MGLNPKTKGIDESESTSDVWEKRGANPGVIKLRFRSENISVPD